MPIITLRSFPVWLVCNTAESSLENTQPARSIPARSSIEEVGQHGSGSEQCRAASAAVGARREVPAVPGGVDRAGDAAGGGRAVEGRPVDGGAYLPGGQAG